MVDDDKIRELRYDIAFYGLGCAGVIVGTLSLGYAEAGLSDAEVLAQAIALPLLAFALLAGFAENLRQGVQWGRRKIRARGGSDA